VFRLLYGKREDDDKNICEDHWQLVVTTRPPRHAPVSMHVSNFCLSFSSSFSSWWWLQFGCLLGYMTVAVINRFFFFRCTVTLFKGSTGQRLKYSTFNVQLRNSWWTCNVYYYHWAARGARYYFLLIIARYSMYCTRIERSRKKKKLISIGDEILALEVSYCNREQGGSIWYRTSRLTWGLVHLGLQMGTVTDGGY